MSANGLVESGILRQLVAEEWKIQNGFIQVQGIAQLFVKRNVEGNILFIIPMFAQDVLLAGHPEDIRQFHEDIARMFKVGMFIERQNYIFNSLRIHQEENYSISATMQEYPDSNQDPYHRFSKEDAK